MIVSDNMFVLIYLLLAFILTIPFLYFCFVKKVRKPAIWLLLPAFTFFFVWRSPDIIAVTGCGTYTSKVVVFPTENYERGTHNYIINNSDHTLCIEAIVYGDAKTDTDPVYCGIGETIEYSNKIDYLFEDAPEEIYTKNSGEIRYELYCLPTNEEYIEAYNESLKKNPNDIETLFNKGSLLEEMGQIDSAYVNFNKAADIYCEGINDSHSAAYCFARLERWEEAIEVHKKYFDTEDSINVILPNLGYCYIALNSLNEARRCFDNILKSNSEMLTAHLGLAIVNYKENNYDEMKKNIENLWKIDDELSHSFDSITELEEYWGYYFSSKEKQLLKQVFEAYKEE